MRVQVNYLGRYEVEFNKSSEEVELPDGARLLDLLNRLAEANGDGFKSYVFDQSKGAVNRNVLININDKPLHQLQGLKTPLRDGDRIDLRPLFVGGG